MAFVHEHDPAPKVVQDACSERAEGAIYPVLVAQRTVYCVGFPASIIATALICSRSERRKSFSSSSALYFAGVPRRA
jgi:hypothetical protein